MTPSAYTIRFHRYFGRFGVAVSRRRVDGMYGSSERSLGVQWTLTLWRDA